MWIRDPVASHMTKLHVEADEYDEFAEIEGQWPVNLSPIHITYLESISGIYLDTLTNYPDIYSGGAEVKS